MCIRDRHYVASLFFCLQFVDSTCCSQDIRTYTSLLNDLKIDNLWNSRFMEENLQISDVHFQIWLIFQHDAKYGVRRKKNPSSRSLKLHVKYFEKGDRYDDGVNGSGTGNQQWTTIGTMTFDLGWPWHFSLSWAVNSRASDDWRSKQHDVLWTQCHCKLVPLKIRPKWK